MLNDDPTISCTYADFVRKKFKNLSTNFVRSHANQKSLTWTSIILYENYFEYNTYIVLLILMLLTAVGLDSGKRALCANEEGGVEDAGGYAWK